VEIWLEESCLEEPCLEESCRRSLAWRRSTWSWLRKRSERSSDECSSIECTSLEHTSFRATKYLVSAHICDCAVNVGDVFECAGHRVRDSDLALPNPFQHCTTRLLQRCHGFPSDLEALAGVSNIFGPVSQATSVSNAPPPPSSSTAPPVTSAIALPPITGTTAPPNSVISAAADDSSDYVGGPDDGVDPNNLPGSGLGPGALSPPPKKRAARMQA